ncbi:MAG: homoserine dehydrogenase [Planctomycetaceae bacterium]|nr:homoserine dehydrogenase [Planctomycetaceae bacterium]
MSQSEPLNIALIGFGTVGSGVARILAAQSQRIAVRAGREIRLKRVVVRDVTRSREYLPAGVSVSADVGDIINDSEIQLAVQLMGGIDPALDYMQRLLSAGKDIVTANKALLYQHGATLFEHAAGLRRTIGFEAAVAGGIPIISAVTQALTGNRILSLEAILNGTSNFILTNMLAQRQSYHEVLAEAQQRGYAEADPTMDVDGTDAAQKLSILTQLAFSTRVPLENFVRQGIQDLEFVDLQTAAELGYKIKLLATSRIRDERLELSVQPTLIRRERTIAQIDGADNIVAVTGDAVGTTTFSGAGAGQLPTASAVMADIVDYATGRTQLTFQSILRSVAQPPLPVQPAEELSRRYYLRFTVDDRPHVLADIADILGRNEISISSVRQDETPEDPGRGTARLVIMTHRTTEGQLRAAGESIRTLSCIQGTSISLPVAD